MKKQLFIYALSLMLISCATTKQESKDITQPAKSAKKENLLESKNTVSGEIPACADKQTELIESIKNSDLMKAKELILKGISPLCTDSLKNTPMHYLFNQYPLENEKISRESVFEIMPNKKEQLLSKNNEGKYPIEYAIFYDVSKESFKQILETASEVLELKKEIIILPVMFKKKDLADLIFEKKSVNTLITLNSFEASPLSMSLLMLDDETVDYLLSKGADINNGRTFSPLFVATLTGREKYVQLFIDKGVDINQQDSNKSTALSCSIIGKHAFESVKTGLLQMMKIDATGLLKDLFFSFKSDYQNVFKILLNKKANPNIADSTGATPLVYAASTMSKMMISELINAGADVEKAIQILEEREKSGKMNSSARLYLFYAAGKENNMMELGKTLCKENNIFGCAVLSDFFSNKNNYKDALIFSKRMIEIDPLSIVGLNNIGWSNIVLGNLNDAEISLKKSIEINPTPNARFNLAHIYTIKGKEEEAKIQYQISIVEMLREGHDCKKIIKEDFELLRKTYPKEVRKLNKQEDKLSKYLDEVSNKKINQI